MGHLDSHTHTVQYVGSLPEEQKDMHFYFCILTFRHITNSCDRQFNRNEERCLGKENCFLGGLCIDNILRYKSLPIY